MLNQYGRHLLCCTILAAGTMGAMPVYAQTSGVTDTGNEIIVTAQRRAERLEDVPVAITAVSGEMLERSGVKTIADIGQVAAGVQVNRGGAFSQPAIRGISTLTLGYGFENNVAVYVDGFYQPDAVSINGDLVNLSGIQVLKGPQGTLYGRNATGGALVIDTLAPSSTLTGSGEVAYGRFNDLRVKAYLSGPVADGINFSVAGFHRKSDGYIRDVEGFDTAPIRNTTLRAKLEIKPGNNFTATFGYNRVFSDDSRGMAYTYTDYHLLAGLTPTPANKPDTSSLNGRPDASVRMDEFTGKLQWDTGIGMLSSYTGYAHRHSHSVFDIDGSKLQPSLAAQTGLKQDTFQQSFDYAIDAINRLDLVVGASYYKDVMNNRGARRYQGTVPPAAPDGIQDVRLSSKAIAAYVDATLELTDKLFVTAGVRYSDEHREFYYNERPGYAGAVVFLPRTPVEANYSAATPRAVVRYEVGARTNIYASYTEGFRSGIFNPAVVPDPVEAGIPVRPEKIKSFEIGFKTAGSNFRFDTAAYYYDYRDLQVAVTALGPPRVILFNAPKAEIYGAEAQFSYTPVRNLDLRGGLAYVHARYRDFTDAAGNPLAYGTGLNAGIGFNTTQRQDWSDQQMARAPTWTANAAIDYTTDLAGGSLTATLNGNYSSSYVVTNASLYGPLDPTRANQQRYRQDGYGVLNISANWTDPSGQFTLGAYADNFTNTRFALIYSGSAYGDYKQYADPATYGVRAGFKF